MNHKHFMDAAIELSKEALHRGDWPVGVVLVRDDRIIATGQNRQNTQNNPTVHAEMDAIRSACEKGVSLQGATIYAPMEPCPMCAWALRLSGVDRMVLGVRHADLCRVDLGIYTIERFAEMLGYRADIVSGMGKEEYLAIRRRWGQDKTKDA
jgi:tRNA(adenine34) deaminase